MSSHRIPLPSSPTARLSAAVALVRSVFSTLDRWLAVGGAGVALVGIVDRRTDTRHTAPVTAAKLSAVGAPRLPVAASRLPAVGARP
jgi:hypothetical protein